MRLAMSWVYCEPKSRTRILWCGGPMAVGEELEFNFRPIVGRFSRDDDVVDVTLAQSGLGQLDEAGLFLHVGDGAAATVPHPGAKAADQLIHNTGHRAPIGNPSLDAFRNQFLHGPVFLG